MRINGRNRLARKSLVKDLMTFEKKTGRAKPITATRRPANGSSPRRTGNASTTAEVKRALITRRV
jgi:hypothetical protein